MSAVPGSPEATISVLMQRVVQSESYSPRTPIECQASELRAVLESREQWHDLARQLEAERDALQAQAEQLERERDRWKNLAEQEYKNTKIVVAMLQAQVAALREALANELPYDTHFDGPSGKRSREVLHDTESAAQAYRAKIRAEAFREAAQWLRKNWGGTGFAEAESERMVIDLAAQERQP